jgi:hypothetical protein
LALFLSVWYKTNQMKKLIIAASAVIFSISASAQHTSFGFKGGLNISDFSDDSDVNFKSRTSFHLGGLAHIHLTRNFALQPELVYSEQGAKISSVEYRFNYLNIPVLLQYMAGNGFRIQTGPQLGLLVSGKAKSGNTTVDIKDELKKADFAWSIGASYLSPARVGIDVRYNLGISNLDEGEDLKNNVFQLGVFYQFN